MAEDIHNEGSEEEKKDNSSQDEDFGLPDLEFEELEELDLNMDDSSEEETAEDTSGDEMLVGADDIDMSVLDDIEETEPAESTLDEGINEIEDVLDSAQLISDRLGDDEDEDDLTSSAEVEITKEKLSDVDVDFSSLLETDDDLETVDKSTDDFSIEGMSTESVTGLSDAELEALMTPPEPVSDVELISDDGNSSSDIDDLLAGIDSPDELAALGLADEEEAPEINEEETAMSSLFAADDNYTDTSDSNDEAADLVDPKVVMEEPASGGSIFESDSSIGSSSIFESDSIALEATSSGSENIEFQKPEEASLPSDYKPYTYDEATTGNFAKVIVVGVVIITLIGFALLYFDNQFGESDTKQITEKANTHKPAAKKKAKKEPAKIEKASTPNTEAEKPKKVVKKTPVVKKEPVKATVQSAAPGEILAITERTGRVYVIVGSFIDGDIAMDYARNLSKQGKGIKIINPYGKSINYRVTVADYASVSEATSNLNSLKADFGDGVWALKY